MAEPNVLSSKIKIFPAANRDLQYDSQSRLMSEENVTGIIKSIASKDSYVVSELVNDTPFKFVINGYLVELENVDYARQVASNPDNSIADDLYAYINIITDNGYPHLSGSDTGASDVEDSIYTGVSFSKKEQEDVPCLQLIGDGKVPIESLQKFDEYTLGLYEIDCGYIDWPTIEQYRDTISSN